MTTRRFVALVALIGAFLLGSMVRLEQQPPPVQAFTLSLAWAAGGDAIWESPVLPATATVAGLGWDDEPPEAAWIRSSIDGEVWSDWVAIPLDLEHGPDSTSPEAANERAASGPVYLGQATHLQFRVNAPDPEGLRAELIETAGRGLSLWERAAHLWERVEWADPPKAEASPDQPPIVTRDAWGGDACLALSTHPEADYNRRVSAAFIHHTTGSQPSTTSSALDEIYAICRYHVVTREFWDIAYNFLIDTNGTIYEGRHGGIDEPVRGAHTKGFNSYSMGIALLGTYSTSTPSAAQQQAVVDLTAWKFDLDHVDPTGTVTVENLTENFKFDEGEVVTLNTVSGHRNAEATSCPGDACYSIIPSFRTRIEESGGNKLYWQPSADPVIGFQTAGYEPVSFRMGFTIPMSWSLEITDESAGLVYSAAGHGSTAVATWDGTFGGANLPYGEYLVTVDAVPDSGEVPRPVSEWIQLGSYLPPFADDEDSLHQMEIIELASLGITRGCNPPDNDLFCPKSPVTRGELAAFLVRALDLRESADADLFTDDDESIFEADIEKLAVAGITNGCNPPVNDRYCPNDSVTRGQMAAFLVRAFQFAVELPQGDRFVDDDGSIFEADIERLAAAGITRGCNPPDNTEFCPDRNVSRAEMATFLIRSLDQ